MPERFPCFGFHLRFARFPLFEGNLGGDRQRSELAENSGGVTLGLRQQFFAVGAAVRSIGDHGGERDERIEVVRQDLERLRAGRQHAVVVRQAAAGRHLILIGQAQKLGIGVSLDEPFDIADRFPGIAAGVDLQVEIQLLLRLGLRRPPCVEQRPELRVSHRSGEGCTENSRREHPRSDAQKPQRTVTPSGSRLAGSVRRNAGTGLSAVMSSVRGQDSAPTPFYSRTARRALLIQRSERGTFAAQPCSTARGNSHAGGVHAFCPAFCFEHPSFRLVRDRCATLPIARLRC